MDVGFIGLGHMGAPMAQNLLKAGHHLIVYNRTRGKVETLAREGAQIADRVADACQGEILITMLADDPAVEGVVFGDRGAHSALRRDANKLFIIAAGADAMLNVAISCLLRWVRRHLSSATDPP